MLRASIVSLARALVAALVVTFAGEASSQIVLAQTKAESDAIERTIRDCTRSAAQKIPGHEIQFEFELFQFGTVRAPNRTPKKTLAEARDAAISCIVKKGGKKTKVDQKGGETYRFPGDEIVVEQWDSTKLSGWVSLSILGGG